MAASFVTIVLFFVYLWGLGFTGTYFVKKPENSFERQILNLAIGLGIFPILSILLNFLHIPLDWKVFLFLSLAFPLFILFKNYKNIKVPSFKLRKSDLALVLVLLIALASFYMYAKGAFAYPYLEDEDPWGHSVGAKYVAIEKNAYDPPLAVEDGKIDLVLSYIDPYPPAYDILMGILHQTADDLTWVLKFFNALIISLGLVFFYLFANRFMENRNKALFATFILAALPSYLSHFIWAHSLVVTLFFPAMYAFLMINEDKRWTFIAAILVASIWVTQNFSQPIKLSSMLLLFIIVASITNRKFMKYEFLALIGGIFLSLFWWGAMIKKYSLKGFVGYFSGDYATAGKTLVLSGSSGFDLKEFLISFVQTITKPGGTGSRAYTFSDFFFAKGQNAINNPVGIGIFISLLVLLGVLYIFWRYKSAIVVKKNSWLAVTLFWLIFTFWGVNGQTFPISVARGPFRVWMLMAIPLSLVATEGFYAIKYFFGRLKYVKFLVTFLIILGVILTSASQKYELNTAIWPTSGSYTSQQEPFQYGQWFESIPKNTNVFLYSPRDKLTIGFGAFSCLWCQSVVDFRNSVWGYNAEELHTFLRNEEYEFFIINPRMDFKYFSSQMGENGTEDDLKQKYDEIIESGLFTPVYQAENSFIVLRVN